MSEPQEKFPVVIVQHQSLPPGLNQASEALKKNVAIQFEMLPSIKDATSFLKQTSKALLLLVMAQKDDLVGTLEFLAVFQNQIKSGVIRVIVVDLLKHPKVPGMLQSKGCRDLLEPTASSKAILYKIQQMIQIIEKAAANSPANFDKKIDSSSKQGSGKDKNSESRDTGKEIKFVEALQLPSDCWLLANKKDARNVMGRWLIEMVGPGPAAGSWNEFNGSKTEWEWVPKKTDTKDPFILDLGKWIYKGRQPEFIWKTNRWQFVSNEPSLGFLVEGAPSIMRFQLEKTALLFAENSQHAKNKLRLIQATFDSEVRFDADKKEGSKGQKRDSDSERGDQDKNADAFDPGCETKFVDALQGQMDCWILENKKDARNVMGRWLIDLVGPGPSAGSWAEVKGKNSDWKWVPKNPEGKDPFILDPGTWIFRGREPEFSWKTNRWLFVGKKASLGFYHEGALRGSRFQLENSKILLVSENSDHAKTNLPLIQATFACEAHFEAEKIAALKPKDYIDKDETPESKTKDFIDKEEELESKTKDFLDEDDTPESKTKDFLNKDETPESKTKDFLNKDETQESKTKDFIDEDDTKEPNDPTQHNLNDDPNSPDWNGSDLKKDSVFNNGGGIGLGQKKEREGYDFDEPDYTDSAGREVKFKSGAEAFVSMILTVKMKLGLLDQPGDWVAVELLENGVKEVMVETSMENLNEGTPVSFQFLLKDGSEETSSEVVGVVRINEPLDDAGFLVSVVFEASEQTSLRKIAALYAGRQEEAKEFMKAAKGY